MSWNEIFILIGLCALVLEMAWFGTNIIRAVRAGKITIPATQNSQSETARVLVIGDSTAYGTGASRPATSMVGRLIQDFPSFTVVNASENAMSLAQVRKKMTLLSDNHFDIVMIHVGGIDVLSFTPMKSVQAELRQIFALAKTMGAKVTVLVSVNNVGSAPLFHFPFNYVLTRQSRILSLTCTEECQLNDVVHVPLFTDRENEPLLADGKKHFSIDGIHPNDDGYALWYNQINVTVSPFLLHYVTTHDKNSTDSSNNTNP